MLRDKFTSLQSLSTRCQFHQHLTRAFFIGMSFQQLFLRTYVEKSCLNDARTENARV